MTATYWGPHFPVDTSYWDGHFPDEAPSTGFPGYGEKGAATFALDLENGFKVKHKWITDIEKYFSAKERRYARNDAPQESYDGSALLLENQPRDIRTILAESAAAAAQFAFSLPHEALLVTAVDGNTVSVQASQLALTDWAHMGQRCVVKWLDDDNNSLWQDAIIQAEPTGTEILLDITPNADALELMPVRPCFLEPQQSFPRYPVNAEAWQLVARAAIFDFAPKVASVPIRDITEFFPPTGAIAYVRKFGAIGNTIRLIIVEAEGYGEAGEIVSEDDTSSTFGVDPGVTTLDDFKALLDGSENFFLGGTYTGSDTIAWDQDELATGGSDAGDIGNGATLTVYDDGDNAFPVWDRRIAGETATDSLQAMTHLFDQGGLIDSISTSPRADWGRAVALKHGDRDVWQWLKKFTYAMQGAKGSFWFPTWRNDMDFVSKAAGTITVEVDALDTWYPSLRDRLQIIERDGTVTYAKITDATDNDDGTWTLSIVDGASDPITLASSNVELVSWLELCRFENDEFEFSFGQQGVTFSAIARAIDNIVTDGQPREYVEISYGTTTHRMAFTTRDFVDDDGVLYPVVAGGRSSIGVGSPAGYKDPTITLPITHAFVQRYMRRGIPPSKITATITRKEIATETWFTGEIDGMSLNDELTEATFKIISKGSKVSLRVIPSVVVGSECPHTLFEGGCGRGISRDGDNPDGIPYLQTTTVTAISGNDVTIDLSNVGASFVRRPKWCKDGEFIHTASGERRIVRDQNDVEPGVTTITVLTLDLPIVELEVGDSIDVYPGCDHELRGDYGCNLQFGNRQNFGGLPELPDFDLWTVGHLVRG